MTDEQHIDDSLEVLLAVTRSLSDAMSSHNDALITYAQARWDTAHRAHDALLTELRDAK